MAKKFTANQLETKWEEYKHKCDSETKLRTDFSPSQCVHITTEVPAPVSYSIRGFLNWIGLDESSYYENYAKAEETQSLHARILKDCEESARKGFEKGNFAPQLAKLWMSNYGWREKTETEVTASEDTGVKIVIAGGDSLAK